MQGEWGGERKLNGQQKPDRIPFYSFINFLPFIYITDFRQAQDSQPL